MKPFKWQEGEVVQVGKNSSLLVRQQTYLIEGKKKPMKRKAYVYQCLKCNYIGTRREPDFLGFDCPVCSNNIIKWDINSVVVKRPDLISCFKNIEEAYMYGEYGSQKVDMICPICGKDLPQKIINCVTSEGLFCPYCSNKSSYAERIMRELLEMCKEEYIPQKKFEWSNNRIYDFYLPKKNWIIEIHGEQHYDKHSNFVSLKGKTYKEEHMNDIRKCWMCWENGMLYIDIDCRKSNFEYIYNSMINNKYIQEIISDTYIDKTILEQKASASVIGEVSELWNKGYTSPEIKDILGYGATTIQRYIKQADKLGLLNDYGNKKSNQICRSSGVKCINTNTLECYWKITDAAKEFGIKKASMSKKCHNKKDGYELFSDYVNEHNIENEQEFFLSHLALYYSNLNKEEI